MTLAKAVPAEWTRTVNNRPPTEELGWTDFPEAGRRQIGRSPNSKPLSYSMDSTRTQPHRHDIQRPPWPPSNFRCSPLSSGYSQCRIFDGPLDRRTATHNPCIPGSGGRCRGPLRGAVASQVRYETLSHRSDTPLAECTATRSIISIVSRLKLTILYR